MPAGRRLRCALALGAATVVAAIPACGDDRPSRADQGRAVGESAGLPDEVADFLALAAAGPDATFWVVYATADAEGNPITVRIDQRPPDRRVEVITADGIVDTTLTTDEVRQHCNRTPGAEVWACQPTSAAGSGAGRLFEDASLQRTIDALRDQADDFSFRLEDRTIAGAAARCLVTEPVAGGTPSTLCVSGEGAQLLVEVATGRIEAQQYGTDIDDDRFNRLG